MSEGTDSVLRSLATAWKKGNWLAGTDATKMHLNPGGGRGEARGGGGALTWEEGYSAGGGFLCALVVTFQPVRRKSQYSTGHPRIAQMTLTQPQFPQSSQQVSAPSMGGTLCAVDTVFCVPTNPSPAFKGEPPPH